MLTGRDFDEYVMSAGRGGRLSRWVRWRGVPMTELALLLGGPLLMGAVLVMALFRLNLQAVRADYPPRVQAWLPTLFALAYVLSALTAGRWVGARGPGAVMVLTVAGGLGLALAVPTTQALGWMLVLSAGVGVVAGAYFVAFQVNIQNVQPFHTLAWSIACFNISWGLGEVSGPALASTVGLWPLRWLAVVLVAVSAVHAALIVLAARSPRPTPTARMAAELRSTPRLRVVGWVSMFLATLVYMALIATLYPGLGHARSWSDGWIALGVVVLAMPVALTAPLWAKLRGWLHTPALLLVSLALLGAALAVLPWLTAWWAVSVALALAGVALGSVTFQGVYYANADPDKPARSVGINEAAAGCGAMLGPAAIGALAWDEFTAARAYLGPGALLIATAVGLGVWWAWTGARRSWIARESPGRTISPPASRR